MSDDKLGIEYSIFEYHGHEKKKILNFRPAPGNIHTGLEVMRDKLGINIDEMKEHMKKHTESIMKGTIKRK